MTTGEQKARPTIAELEAMLKAENERIEILPSGEVISVNSEMVDLIAAHDQHGYCPNCGCDLWNTKGCPTCPLMRRGHDILVKLGLAKPRQYAEYMEADDINHRNMAKGGAQ